MVEAMPVNRVRPLGSPRTSAKSDNASIALDCPVRTTSLFLESARPTRILISLRTVVVATDETDVS